MGNTTSLTDEYPTRDIINLIVDITDVRVFHKLRRVSKLLQYRVDATTYGSYYRKFMENDGDSLQMILQYYSRFPKIPITMADFFDELKKPKCECGHYAWQVSLFSFPPRRICFWGDSINGLNYEGLNLTTQELAKLFNIPEDDLNVLPKIWPRPQPSDLALMDLKTVERIASRQHGKTFMKSATEKLIRDFPDVIETSGWGTSFIRPVTVGIDDPGNRNGEITTTLSQLLCSHCYSAHAEGTEIIPSHVSQPDTTHVYPYVPHDYHHLREHFSLYHIDLLEAFEAGWNDLPVSARRAWSRGGNYRSSSLLKMSQGFPQFLCWSNSFREMWKQQTQDMEQNLVRWRSNWMLEYGHLNAWRTRDIQVNVPNAPSDMSLALDGYYMMMEYKALNEFGRRWRQDRVGLWREICEFWKVADILPYPPAIPTE